MSGESSPLRLVCSSPQPLRPPSPLPGHLSSIPMALLPPLHSITHHTLQLVRKMPQQLPTTPGEEPSLHPWLWSSRGSSLALVAMVSKLPPSHHCDGPLLQASSLPGLVSIPSPNTLLCLNMLWASCVTTLLRGAGLLAVGLHFSLDYELHEGLDPGCLVP